MNPGLKINSLTNREVCLEKGFPVSHRDMRGNCTQYKWLLAASHTKGAQFFAQVVKQRLNDI